MTTVQRPAECRTEKIEPPPKAYPKACPYTFHGRKIAEVSRGGLRRLARDKNIPFAGDTKGALYSAITVHLQQIGWPPERDLSKLKKAKA